MRTFSFPIRPFFAFRGPPSLLALVVVLVANAACGGSAPAPQTEAVPIASTREGAPPPVITPDPAGSTPAAKEGLVIEDLVVGSGDEVRRGDRVRVLYRGTLTDGGLFDSTRGRGPFETTVGKGEVIKGWDRGMPGMRVGGKRRLVIPYELAYGEAGNPPLIPERATLIFEIELVEIVRP